MKIIITIDNKQELTILDRIIRFLIPLRILPIIKLSAGIEKDELTRLRVLTLQEEQDVLNNTDIPNVIEEAIKIINYKRGE